MLPARTRTVTSTAEKVSWDWGSVLRADGVPAAGSTLDSVQRPA